MISAACVVCGWESTASYTQYSIRCWWSWSYVLPIAGLHTAGEWAGWRRFGAGLPPERGVDSLEAALEAAPDPAPRLDLVLAECTAALDEQRAPSVSLADNLRTLDVVLAMIRSSEERRRVPLPSSPGV